MNHNARTIVTVLLVFGLGVLSQSACKKEEQASAEPESQPAVVQEDKKEQERKEAEWLKLYLKSQELISALDFEQCLLVDRETLEYAEKNFPPDSKYVAQSLTRLASTETSLGQYAEAEKHRLRAHSIHSVIYRPEHSFAVINLEGLGKLYMSQGKYENAVETLDGVVEIQEKNGLIIPPLGPPFKELVQCYTELKQYPELEKAYHRWIAYLEGRYSSEHADVLAVRRQLGQLYMTQAKYDEAEKQYQRMLEISKKIHGSHHISTQTIRGMLLILYTNKGDLESARRIQEDTNATAGSASEPE